MKARNGYSVNGHVNTDGSQPKVRAQSGCKSCLDVANQVWTLKSPIMLAVAFIGTLPLPLLVQTSEARCAYVVVAMALLWVTEAVPIPVTALVPVVLFPALGVLEAPDVANSYMGNTSMLFIGGLLVAIAVEECGLHRRVALSVMRLVGSDPKWIMLGMMLPTWFLSMWISNTATASMMVPIVEAILVQLKIANKPDSCFSDDMATISTGVTDNHRGSKDDGREEGKDDSGDNNEDISEARDDVHPDEATTPGRQEVDLGDATETLGQGVNPNGQVLDTALTNRHVTIRVDDPDSDDVDDASSEVHDEADAYYERLCKGLSLSIAYAANTGGIATLTGTPPNLVFSGQAKKYFDAYGGTSGVTFLSWMLMAFPLSLLMLVLCWVWLVIIFLRGSCKKQPKEVSDAVKQVMQNEYKRLGKISLAEVQTLVLFIIVALLWLSRDPQFVEGWGVLFLKDYMSDSQSAVFVGLLFFVLPAKKPTIFCWRYRNGIRQKASYTPLLTWQVAQAKMPWGIIVLLGGGFALAKGCRVSGLSDWFGEQLATFEDLDPWIINLIICAAVAMATEITSNTATATLLMPIMAELSLRLKVNPLYFMSSAALATSFAFMMPVATPPNAIVFSHGHLSIPDMASAGAIMNVIAILCLCLCVNTWGDAVFNFGTLPAVFNNETSPVTLDDLRSLSQEDAMAWIS